MKSFERKMQTRIRMHPEMLRTLLAMPTEETLETLTQYRIFESKNTYLGQLLFSLIPQWEYLACDGNEPLGKLLRLIDANKISPIPSEDQNLRSNLLRIRILAETPGLFPFSPYYIQENLLKFLESSDVIADLPQLEVITFTAKEIAPLATELENYRLSPIIRRYVQNLFHPERRESILSVLAYLAKNYPLLGTCRQSYALMLSLDEIEKWNQHPFCLRLIANRYWDYRSRGAL